MGRGTLSSFILELQELLLPDDVEDVPIFKPVKRVTSDSPRPQMIPWRAAGSVVPVPYGPFTGFFCRFPTAATPRIFSEVYLELGYISTMDEVNILDVSRFWTLVVGQDVRSFR